MLLEIENLNVKFHVKGREKNILNNISFKLRKQEVLGIVGGSGSGKSVTARSILKLVPTPPLSSMSGRMLYLGRDLMPLSNQAMRIIRGRDIAYIFQEPMTAMNPVLPVGEQIVEMIRAHENVSKEEARNRGIRLLEETGISSPELRMKCFAHELSGGMRQRTMIAMALSCNPRILIADEPTTALDVTIQAQILSMLKRLKKDRHMSIIFITHDLRVIAEIADRVLVMHEGETVEEGGVEKLFHDPRHPYTQKMLEFIS